MQIQTRTWGSHRQCFERVNNLNKRTIKYSWCLNYSVQPQLKLCLSFSCNHLLCSTTLICFKRIVCFLQWFSQQWTLFSILFNVSYAQSKALICVMQCFPHVIEMFPLVVFCRPWLLCFTLLCVLYCALLLSYQCFIHICGLQFPIQFL